LSARILVVDDETNIRTMIRLTLEHVGYQVGTAADGKDALEKYEDGAEWDLVLLDQRMPGMSGSEVQKEIYRRNPLAKLILITAFGTIDLAIEAIQAGASDFLRKPFTSETLRASVKSALDKAALPATTVPLNIACREFTRANINGFSFEFSSSDQDDATQDITCVFDVSHTMHAAQTVQVVLPAYVMELVKAYIDSETVPGGKRFWHALCEEALANYLWQNAEIPEGGILRIEDLTSSLQRWLDSVLTVCLTEEDA
jgi:CheY-like chemotaxis protein